ncbi:MAG: flagellar hook-associated protein FlgK [Peptococcaceae bacterium]|jgi:flagellar hook-associated protein 1 FlgK|nr:flagellar hook-associated protein FlgK [Peptococcaceae bacterium]
MIRPTFMGFETAKRGIEVNQKAIDIVANNLSNVDVAGYTRQRLDTASIAPSAYSTKVTSSRIGILGQGVEGLGVGQIRDSFLDKRFRDEYAKASYHSQASTLLQDLQGALGDGGDITDESVVFGAIAKLYRSLHDYAYEPTLDSQANIVLAAFRNFTQVLQQLDAKVRNVADAQIFEASQNVARVNEIANEIAHYNYLISRDATVMQDPNNEYFRPNELLDKRNLLLDELASYGNIDVTTLANGMVNVKFGGEFMVIEKEYETINLETHPDQTIGFVWTATGKEIQFTAGSMKATADFMNGRGKNAQNTYETSYEGIPYYKDRLNTLAKAFANLVNSTIPIRENPDIPGDNTYKTDANGDIQYKALVGARQEDGSVLPNGEGLITAANITISKEWTNGGPGYFVFSKFENIDNFALELATGLTSGTHKFVSYGEIFQGTFEDYVAEYVTKLASEIKYQDGRFESTALMADDFLDRRDEISGVNRDEETANMLIFQKSYNAAARLMTTLDEMVDVIINRMGIVGR